MSSVCSASTHLKRLSRLSSQLLVDNGVRPNATGVVGTSSVCPLRPQLASGGARRSSSDGGVVACTQPRLYLGTMTFAWDQASSPVGDDIASAMVRRFLSAGGVELDTARIYSAGATEPMLGRVLKEMSSPYRIATKAHPSQPHGLSDVGIRSQLDASLQALGLDKVDVLYLHQPDPQHDIVESLRTVQNLIAEGKVGALGVSNYSAVETERICTLCQEHNWTLPSFYQGLYNPLNRLVEEELLPVLRRFNVGFIAFNPLAAGLLSGKHQRGGEVLAGRFKDNPNYLPRFYTDANFIALENIKQACQDSGIGIVPATYAWMLGHSALDASKGDGLLLGCSSILQLEENLSSCMEPVELPTNVVEAFDGAWSICKGVAFPFWRSYSRDQPGRESLDPGASYQAHGPK